MPQFMIQVSYPPDECRDVLDRMQRESPDLIPNTCFGTMDGDPTLWSMVDACCENAARDMLPLNLRDWARISEVSTYNVEQLKSMSEQAA